VLRKNVNVKLSRCLTKYHAKKMYGEWRNGSTHSRHRHWTEVSCQLHAPAALSGGKSRLYTLDRRLGEPQSQCGRGGEKKNFLSLPGIEPRLRSSVTTLTELPHLTTSFGQFVNNLTSLWASQKTSEPFHNNALWYGVWKAQSQAVKQIVHPTLVRNVQM
jgi:hypothetical protein